jgi:hypothetical protein
MEHDQLLADLEAAIAEARDVVDRLERAYIILCEQPDRPSGHLIHLDRNRTISELANEARGSA